MSLKKLDYYRAPQTGIFFAGMDPEHVAPLFAEFATRERAYACKLTQKIRQYTTLPFARIYLKSGKDLIASLNESIEPQRA